MVAAQAEVPLISGVFAANAPPPAEPDPTPEPIELKLLKPPEPVSKWSLGEYGSDDDAQAKCAPSTGLLALWGLACPLRASMPSQMAWPVQRCLVGVAAASQLPSNRGVLHFAVLLCAHAQAPSLLLQAQQGGCHL